jgi:hypothetical protein
MMKNSEVLNASLDIIKIVDSNITAELKSRLNK